MKCNRTVQGHERFAPDGSVYDETTGHVLVSKENTTIEMKYCPSCKEWHPLTDYYNNKNTKDGLCGYCKQCLRMKSLKKAVKKNKSLSGNVVIIQKTRKKSTKQKTPIDVVGNTLYDFINSLTEKYTKQIAELKKKVCCLEKELNTQICPDKMTDAEFERFVMSRKGVQPRVYFNAIKNLDIDNKYTIKVYDSSTGLTTTVKTDVA